MLFPLACQALDPSKMTTDIQTKSVVNSYGSSHIYTHTCAYVCINCTWVTDLLPTLNSIPLPSLFPFSSNCVGKYLFC